MTKVAPLVASMAPAILHNKKDVGNLLIRQSSRVGNSSLVLRKFHPYGVRSILGFRSPIRVHFSNWTRRQCRTMPALGPKWKQQ
uniref:Uncharacterized protein n=1 Tax=Physcomitrium patens TaxID=3218 RepID=A0A2K1JPU8_PHYPA|nr:hypothetical protein PHYPA_015938 [Physcomitrium patens]